ncbi:MAG: hypothetical protein AAFP86_06300, partial [Planctomycetota bacterium]
MFARPKSPSRRWTACWALFALGGVTVAAMLRDVRGAASENDCVDVRRIEASVELSTAGPAATALDRSIDPGRRPAGTVVQGVDATVPDRTVRVQLISSIGEPVVAAAESLNPLVLRLWTGDPTSAGAWHRRPDDQLAVDLPFPGDSPCGHVEVFCDEGSGWCLDPFQEGAAWDGDREATTIMVVPGTRREIRVGRPGSIRGRVLQPTYEDLDLWVEFVRVTPMLDRRDELSRPRWAQLSSNGRFTVKDVPAGLVRIE